MKTFALSALIAFAAAPALAQTKVHQEEYYVIRDSATKTCTVVDKRPASTTNVLTTAADHYRRARRLQDPGEAEAALKKMDVCDDEDQDEDKKHDD